MRCDIERSFYKRGSQLRKGGDLTLVKSVLQLWFEYNTMYGFFIFRYKKDIRRMIFDLYD